MANEYQELTPLRLAWSDLHTIRRVLHSYANELRRNPPLLPYRDGLLKTIESICERIGAVKITREREASHEFSLSSDEFTIVDRVLTAYVVSIGQSIPPSEERDEIMRGCEALRVQIMAGQTLSDPSAL